MKFKRDFSENERMFGLDESQIYVCIYINV